MSHHHSKKRRIATAVVIAVAVYWVIAYVAAPLAWEVYAAWRPSFDDDPRITRTSDGHPGDPLNVAIYGEEASLQSIMEKAGWHPAAALGLRSDLRIADDTLLSRPDDDAPVSNLYLYGRKEDLAFEQPVGHNPRQRHHVRFWKTSRSDADNRPLWIGSASYDERVGLSDTTGQITHHISGDIDAERDHLFADLKATGRLLEDDPVAGFHTELEGRNGGGDRWHTDGSLYVGTID